MCFANVVNSTPICSPITGLIAGAASGALGAAIVTLITPTAPVSVPAAAVVFAIAGAIYALAKPCFGDELSYVGSLFAGHALAPSLGYSLAGRAVVHVAIAEFGLIFVFGGALFCCLR